MAYQFVSHGALVAMRYEHEKRGINGLLQPPPKLFVVIYSEERDVVELHPVAWPVARCIDAEAVSHIGVALASLRMADEQAARAAERERAQSEAAPNDDQLDVD